MKLYFLSGQTPLTKSFELDTDGRLVKSSYPLVSEFTSYEEEIGSLQDFRKALKDHASRGRCLLKGLLSRPLVNESRAGSTAPNDLTSWVCLDLDGAVDMRSVEQLLSEVPALRNVDYLLQYSASHGIDPNKKFSAHIFMLLAKPVMPQLLKTWLKLLNLELPLLSSGLSLTRTGMSLRWPLDITTCQNDKLLYIAPPVLGKGIKAPSFQRVKLVEKQHRSIRFDATSISKELVQKKTAARINELREKAGLPKHSLSVKINTAGVEVMSRPGEAEVTGIREGRGFTYLNLNGGDSWGYYHPSSNFEIIYNFKGEPAYQTKELLPTYYAQCLRKQAVPDPHVSEQENTVLLLAFLDPKSDRYYRGTYDTASGAVNVIPVGSVKKLNDYLVCQGEPRLDAVPEWSYEFRFDDGRRIDLEARFINRYQATPYMQTPKTKTLKIPPTINRILNHVMPAAESVEHFLNWLAVIFQKRTKTGTAWVWTGTQGTGKGLFFNRIIVPLLGSQHANSKAISEFEAAFNGFLEDSVLIMIDEAQREGLKSEEKALANLKHYITEPYVSIRRLYSDHYITRSFVNFILASNKPDPIVIAPNDRRFNVSPYQPDRIRITAAEISKLDSEIMAFASYLLSREANEELARTPLVNHARNAMIRRTQKTADGVAEALLSGDFMFFAQALADPQVAGMNEQALAYNIAITDIARRAAANREVKVFREQLHAIFEYLVGDMRSGVYKFTQYLGHHNIVLDRQYNEATGKLHQGIRITWKAQDQELEAVLPKPAAQTGATVVPMYNSGTARRTKHAK